jgi:hypothetical protein
MSYPPSVPSGARINTTPQVNLHPADHLSIHAALSDIINEMGSNPSADFTDITSRLNSLPRGRVGLATKPSNQAGFAGTLVDVSGTGVTISTTAGRCYKLTAEIFVVTAGVGPDVGIMAITDTDDTQLQATTVYIPSSATSWKAKCEVVIAPTGGSKSYKLRYRVVSGSGHTIVSEPVTAPAFLLVEDIGLVP